MKLIVDSGTTKADWRLVRGEEVIAVSTIGINPIFQTVDEILEILDDISNIDPILGDAKFSIHYYGAGVIGDNSILKEAFYQKFKNASLILNSDIIGAARALCFDNEGVVCILGTGSNSCLFDGEDIVERANAGGYILGDEGSGAYFGKRLISDYIKDLLPSDVLYKFKTEFGLDYQTIVSKVYREELPSKFLASFMPFIKDNLSNPYIENLLISGFEDFINRNILRYDKKYSINFVGSIAYYFRDILEKVLDKSGRKIGKILKTPIEGLVEFHM